MTKQLTLKNNHVENGNHFHPLSHFLPPIFNGIINNSYLYINLVFPRANRTYVTIIAKNVTNHPAYSQLVFLINSIPPLLSTQQKTTPIMEVVI